MIYLLLSLSIESKTVYIKNSIRIVFIIFLIITSVSYHQNPKNQFVEISKTIECPKNILHETPFSFLPLSIYLSDCNHYMAKDEDWTKLTHETLYTEPNKINNYDISYDIYFHYFKEFKVPAILDKTNMSDLRLIKVKD